MRVLHVVTGGLGRGGAENNLLKIIESTGKDIEHFVVTLQLMPEYVEEFSSLGIDLHCLYIKNPLKFVSNLPSLLSEIRKFRPDVLQSWLYHSDLVGSILAYLAGIDKIYWGIRHSNLTPGTIKDRTIKIVKICAKLSRWVPRRIVSCSRRAVVTHIEIGYDASKFIVIPNGYNLSRYFPDSASRDRLRSEWGIASGVSLLGMVARFDLQKDHKNLVLALKELKSADVVFHCVLVGTGMDTSNLVLQKLLEEAGVTDFVSLLGRRIDIPDVMNALDLHVLSSLGEAFPNVLAEAMACGTPCVTTDVGDAAYIVGDTGWVVPAQDSKSLAQAIQSALAVRADTNAWQLRQRAVRRRIEDNFTIERVVKAYDALWREDLG